MIKINITTTSFLLSLGLMVTTFFNSHGAASRFSDITPKMLACFFDPGTGESIKEHSPYSRIRANLAVAKLQRPVHTLPCAAIHLCLDYMGEARPMPGGHGCWKRPDLCDPCYTGRGFDTVDHYDVQARFADTCDIICDNYLSLPGVTKNLGWFTAFLSARLLNIPLVPGEMHLLSSGISIRSAAYLADGIYRFYLHYKVREPITYLEASYDGFPWCKMSGNNTITSLGKRLCRHVTDGYKQPTSGIEGMGNDEINHLAEEVIKVMIDASCYQSTSLSIRHIASLLITGMLEHIKFQLEYGKLTPRFYAFLSEVQTLLETIQIDLATSREITAAAVCGSGASYADAAREEAPVFDMARFFADMTEPTAPMADETMKAACAAADGATGSVSEDTEAQHSNGMRRMNVLPNNDAKK